jgi:hypothetical protein
MRKRRRLFLCAMVMLVSPFQLQAQQVHGRLREVGTDAPIAAAVVMLVDSTGWTGPQVLTDTAGVFALTPNVPGMYRLAVERIGFMPLRSEPLSLSPRDTLRLQVYVTPEAVRLEPLLVESRQSTRLDIFYERRARFQKLGIGDFFTREQLERWINHSVSAVLQTVPYLSAASARIGRIGTRSRRCEVGYYVDGVRMRSLFGQSVDDIVRVIDLEAIEVYRGQAELPAEYSDPQSRGCPVVALWTRR